MAISTVFGCQRAVFGSVVVRMVDTVFAKEVLFYPNLVDPNRVFRREKPKKALRHDKEYNLRFTTSYRTPL